MSIPKRHAGTCQLLLLLLATIFISSCATDNPLAPAVRGENEVWIRNTNFEPATLRVNAGTIVTWTNKGDQIQCIESGLPGSPTSDFTPAISGNLKNGDSHQVTFAKAGTFNYYCSITGITGKIIVN